MDYNASYHDKTDIDNMWRLAPKLIALMQHPQGMPKLNGRYTTFQKAYLRLLRTGRIRVDPLDPFEWEKTSEEEACKHRAIGYHVRRGVV